MSEFTITQAVIAYANGTTDCVLQIAVDVPTVGQTFIGRTVSLSSADLSEDWTDAELCEAVATKLGVPVADVAVAEAPVPPPPAPDVPEADFGNPPQVDTPQPLAPVHNPVVGGV